jgi:hypothetical protein
METSQPAQENSSAAANMLTDIVFPNLLGVDISISCFFCFVQSVPLHKQTGEEGGFLACARSSHPFTSKIFWCDLAKAPGGSSFQNGLVQAARYASWNILWWYERFHPATSSASRALLLIFVFAMCLLVPFFVCVVLKCNKNNYGCNET